MKQAGKYITLGLALLLASWTLPSLAQATRAPTQDLLQIWQMAVQRDPIFAASQAGRDAEQEKIPQARAQLLPYITADAVAELNDRRRISGLNNSNSDRRALWALTLTQPIINISAWGGLQRAEYIASLADVAQANAYQDLILRVSQAY